MVVLEYEGFYFNFSFPLKPSAPTHPETNSYSMNLYLTFKIASYVFYASQVMYIFNLVVVWGVEY